MGAMAATCLLGLVVGGAHDHASYVVAPLGSSAVLLFALPESPLARPWSVVGGNTLSALVGICAVHAVSAPVPAGALSLGFAIAVMSVCRCLHPPGGAIALATAVGGTKMLDSGVMFAFAPVAAGSAALVVMAWGFHRCASRRRHLHIGSDDARPYRLAGRHDDVTRSVANLATNLGMDPGDVWRMVMELELRGGRRVLTPTRRSDVGASRHPSCLPDVARSHPM
jgi:CBS domain-containing membrane protein